MDQIEIFDNIEEDNESVREDEYLGNEPFDTTQIKITAKVMTLGTILRRLKIGTINISPEFQRKFVWTPERKSQLIESIILKIPLPMFYVAEDDFGNWEVVDGLQRLSTIRDFVLGPDNDGKGFRLEKLEFLKELNGKNFFEIEKDQKAVLVCTNIVESEFYFTVINPSTPEPVKRTIFKRLNTGGMALSQQEIRHALYIGKSTKLLKELVASNYFTRSTDKSVKDERMGGRELILRFFAFFLLGRKYRVSIDELLVNTMKFINSDSNISEVEVAIDAFKLGSKRSYLLFGSHAFRTSVPGAAKRTAINKSLYEVWINILSKLTEDDFDYLKDKKDTFFQSYRTLIEEDAEFSTSISRYASSSSGAIYRYETLVKLLQNEFGIEV